MQREKFIPSDSEYSKILSTGRAMALKHPYWYDKYVIMIQLCYNCRLRTSECCRVNLSDIDFKEQILHIHATKTGRHESIWINDPTMKALNEYISKYKTQIKDHSDYLFYYSKGKKGKEYLNKNTFNWAWRKILRKAQLNQILYYDTLGRPRQKLRIHDCGAKLITDLLDKHPVDKVMKVSRHKSTQVLLTYYDRRNKLQIQKQLLQNLPHAN